MKQLICIGALILTLSLLTSCNSLSDSEKKDSPKHNIEATIPTDTTAPVATTTNDPIDASTTPTAPAPVETTEPATTEPAATEPATPEPTTPEPTFAPTPPAFSAGFGIVYTDICRLLDSGSWDLEYSYANIGMMEVVGPQNTKTERYSSITYALEDINNDGSQEMIVLDAMGNTRILAIFALQNGQPIMTHEGWARARLYKLSDGTLYREGSNGAAYSIFEADGQRWFTFPKDENQMEAGYYYAADGSYDPTTAQEITADEYNAKQTEFSQMITTFSVYNFSY